jgi:hypothetical protein
MLLAAGVRCCAPGELLSPLHAAVHDVALEALAQTPQHWIISLCNPRIEGYCFHFVRVASCTSMTALQQQDPEVALRMLQQQLLVQNARPLSAVRIACCCIHTHHQRRMHIDQHLASLICLHTVLCLPMAVQSTTTLQLKACA